mgnify:CR=1 FL=1
MNQSSQEINHGHENSIPMITYPSVPQWMLILFCGYVVIWYLQIGYRIKVLGSIRFEFIYAAVLAGITIFSGGLARVKTPILKYVILLFLSIVISAIFSYDPTKSWTVFIDRVVKFSFMFFFISAFVRSPKHLAFFLAAFLLACLKMGQEGFVGKITGSMLWENQGVMRLHGVTPLYEHPNSYAGMALGTIPFIYYLIPLVPKWIKAVLYVGIVFALNIIIFTGSRTGYLALIVGLAFIFYRSKFKKKFIFWAIIFGFVSLPFIPQDYILRFTSIFSGQDKEGHSIDKRKEILKDAWQIFVDHPLGVGVAAFPYVRYKTYGRFQDTHNLYLEVATNLGVQGLIIFLAFVVSMLKLLNSIARSAEKQMAELSVSQQLSGGRGVQGHLADLRLLYAASSATILFLVIRLALGLFGMDLYEIYWWFALGLTTALYHINNISQQITAAYTTAQG